ncbi:hypothetical protein [Halorubrum ezzemoulense]|nr:hypothetical protein [Halorubrum ezzemoulense]MDB2239296.1 hypothetical protein [Halorubrum ezzemoulense]MDB2248589.1 hypothetical protein [Halorubrum ezzemoulense]
MATEKEMETASALDEVIEDIRRVAADDRDSNRNMNNALKSEWKISTIS